MSPGRLRTWHRVVVCCNPSGVSERAPDRGILRLSRPRRNDFGPSVRIRAGEAVREAILLDARHPPPAPALEYPPAILGHVRCLLYLHFDCTAFYCIRDIRCPTIWMWFCPALPCPALPCLALPSNGCGCMHENNIRIHTIQYNNVIM